jgi:hypothetical protein
MIPAPPFETTNCLKIPDPGYPAPVLNERQQLERLFLNITQESRCKEAAS